MTRIAFLKSSTAAVLAVSTFAVPAAVQAAELTGNLGVFSKYILRGNTASPEHEGAVLQGGLDVEFGQGLYAGWWGSELGSAYGAGDDDAGAFENNFYGGWAGELGPLAVSAGLLGYYYVGSEDSNTVEATAAMGYAPFELGVAYMLTDADWSNADDTYLTASYALDLPYRLTLTALASYYIYSDSGEFEDELETSESSAFRHFDLTLSAPVGNTGAEMSVSYIGGGKLRDGFDLGNTLVLGLSYDFSL